MRNKLFLGLISVTLIAGAAACSDETAGEETLTDDGGNGAGASSQGGNGSGGAPEAEPTMLAVSLSGLQPAGDGYVYEGWVIVDGQPVTTGRFNVVDGTSDYEMWVDSATAWAASAFVLTLEPEVDDVPAPSATHILAGDLTDGEASLTVDHPAALGTDFSNAWGQYILNTPTSAAVADDYNQGIWFLTPPMPFQPSLVLPELPDGFVYEGWVAGPDGPISTGRFTSVDSPDSDGNGPYAGPDAGPPFPGSDFIDPAMVLTDGFAAVISVEPEPDDSPAPFVLKPLVDMSIEDVGVGTPQDMSNNAAASNPTGTVTLAM
jgi:hypothetical protein